MARSIMKNVVWVSLFAMVLSALSLSLATLLSFVYESKNHFLMASVLLVLNSLSFLLGTVYAVRVSFPFTTIMIVSAGMVLFQNFVGIIIEIIGGDDPFVELASNGMMGIGAISAGLGSGIYAVVINEYINALCGKEKESTGKYFGVFTLFMSFSLILGTGLQLLVNPDAIAANRVLYFLLTPAIFLLEILLIKIATR